MLGETVIPAQDGDAVAKRVQLWHASFTGSARFPNLNVAAIGVACDAGRASSDQLNRDSVYSTTLTNQGHSSFREEGTMWTVGSALSSIFNTILSPNTSYANCINDPSTNLAGKETVVAASSRHSGGVQVAFADGSVQMISDSILNDTWQRLGGRNDGSVIANDY
jgi:prepilin-type processing-associated H-X9-DG protein